MESHSGHHLADAARSPEVRELIPLAQGGSPYDPANCVLTHRTCNQCIGNPTSQQLAQARGPGHSPSRPTPSRHRDGGGPYARAVPRWLPSVVLVAIGAAAAVVAVLQRSDLALFSIFIGVTSTAIASGLVDLSAVHERHRQAAPLRQLAGRRIGRLHQVLLNIVQVLFDDLHPKTAADWPEALRTAPEGPIDLTTAANVHPPRSRGQYLNDLRAQLLTVLDELGTLSAAGVLTAEVNFLDQTINGPFLSMVEASSLTSSFRTREVIANEAASVIEKVQTKFAAAEKAAGKNWQYGKL